MKAVVFHGPGKVSVEDRPVPKIKDDGDIIVKVDKVRLKSLAQNLTDLCRQRCVAGRLSSYGPQMSHLTRNAM